MLFHINFRISTSIHKKKFFYWDSDRNCIKPIYHFGENGHLYYVIFQSMITVNLAWLLFCYIYTSLIDAKSQLIGKDPDAGKDWGHEERKGNDRMRCLGHWFNGHEFEQTPGDSEGQRSLVCCSLWGCRELDITEQPNNSKILS